MKNMYYKIQFEQHGDERGQLVVVEGNKTIPFDIKRIFYIYGSDANVVRGCHANKKSEFVLINVNGSSKVLVDDGHKQEVIVLDKFHEGLYLPKMLWKEMFDFSEDAVLLVLASEYYDAEEYIRDYESFKKEVKKDE